MGFVGGNWVLNFTEICGVLMNKLCAADNLILTEMHSSTWQVCSRCYSQVSHIMAIAIKEFVPLYHQGAEQVCVKCLQPGSDSFLHVCICCRSVADRMYQCLVRGALPNTFAVQQVAAETRITTRKNILTPDLLPCVWPRCLVQLIYSGGMFTNLHVTRRLTIKYQSCGGESYKS